jgi:hypothetical protein
LGDTRAPWAEELPITIYCSMRVLTKAKTENH